MKTVNIPIEPLTSRAFEPFGEVLQTTEAKVLSINQGTTKRFHNLAHVDVLEGDGKPLINIFEGQPRQIPIEIKLMERHPLGSQAFFPLQLFDYLILVADTPDTPKIQHLKAFRASGIQGVNYRKNTWHHPLLVLSPNHQFLVVDRGGPKTNLEEFFFDKSAARIYLDPRSQN